MGKAALVRCRRRQGERRAAPALRTFNASGFMFLNGQEKDDMVVVEIFCRLGFIFGPFWRFGGVCRTLLMLLHTNVLVRPETPGRGPCAGAKPQHTRTEPPIRRPSRLNLVSPPAHSP